MSGTDSFFNILGQLDFLKDIADYPQIDVHILKPKEEELGFSAMIDNYNQRKSFK
jgi:hypothetical protein